MCTDRFQKLVLNFFQFEQCIPKSGCQGMTQKCQWLSFCNMMHGMGRLQTPTPSTQIPNRCQFSPVVLPLPLSAPVKVRVGKSQGDLLLCCCLQRTNYSRTLTQGLEKEFSSGQLHRLGITWSRGFNNCISFPYIFLNSVQTLGHTCNRNGSRDSYHLSSHVDYLIYFPQCFLCSLHILTLQGAL